MRRARSPAMPTPQANKRSRERRSPAATRDVEVKDPPGDDHRLRFALRRLDHDRPGPARGGRHPRARAGARARHRQRCALRDLHDRRRARLGRDDYQRRRGPPGPARRHDHRRLLRHLRRGRARLLRAPGRPRRGPDQPDHHHRRRGGHPAHLARGQPRQRGSTDAMSSHPDIQAPSDPGRLPMTLPLLAEKKRLSDPIVMVTAYDYPSARAAESAGVDLVLVGDSAATTMLGYNATTPVELDDMLVLARAVRRGLRTPLMIGDLPFGSYEVSDEQAITTAMRMVKEAGCEAVKLEGGGEASVRRARAIVNAGIPVMGHVGLTPQTSTALGGWKAQGRTALAAARIGAEALALQEAGCFALVFEAIPSAVSEQLMPSIEIPVIGIGDGLGPRFVKRYANIQEEMNAGVAAYAEDVRTRRYPGPEHTYKIDPAELDELKAQLG